MDMFTHTLTLSYPWILPFMCFVMKCKRVNTRAPKALQILATFLRPEPLASLFRRQVAEKLYDDTSCRRLDQDPRHFCMFKMHQVDNTDGKGFLALPELFFLTRKSDNSSNIKNLCQKLRDVGRLVGFVEDFEDAFMRGGGAGLAKYLATFGSNFHVALPYRNKSASYTFRCNIIWPDFLKTPGVLLHWSDVVTLEEGRPLKEDETMSTRAPLQYMLRKDADDCGWNSWI